MLRAYRLLLVPLALLLGWLIRHLTEGKSVSVQTASFVVGGIAVLALLGVALGFRTARASEARRKAKEDIWLNH
jgi:biotin transporter BioY